MIFAFIVTYGVLAAGFTWYGCESSTHCSGNQFCNFDFEEGGDCETCPSGSCESLHLWKQKGTQECNEQCKNAPPPPPPPTPAPTPEPTPSPVSAPAPAPACNPAPWNKIGIKCLDDWQSFMASSFCQSNRYFCDVFVRHVRRRSEIEAEKLEDNDGLMKKAIEYLKAGTVDGDFKLRRRMEEAQS